MNGKYGVIMVSAGTAIALWHRVRYFRGLWQLLKLRAASQFSDGLFQAGLASSLLFNPERATDAWAIAGSFAVLFLPYSLIGPFAGALLDHWDRRIVLTVANLIRLVVVSGVGLLLAAGARDLAVLGVALSATAASRFVASGLSAALPHVVPSDQVVSMNSIATATGAVATFTGANIMLIPRWIFGADNTGSAAIMFSVTIPIGIAVVLSLRFSAHQLGPDTPQRGEHHGALYTVGTGWFHGARTVLTTASVAATLSGLAAHRMVFGVNSLMMLVLVRYNTGYTAGYTTDSAGSSFIGLGIAAIFVATTGAGSFLATIITPVLIHRWSRYTAAHGALLCAAIIELVGVSGMLVVLVLCGFGLGLAGQIVKLCADSAMQIDVTDILRGHVFAIQDALFWVSFVVASTAAAAIIPTDGPLRNSITALALIGSAVYLVGALLHTAISRRDTLAT